MTDQGNDSCNVVIKEETEIFDYHIQDPEQGKEYVLDNINDVKPELIQLSLADLDAQFKTWENFFREQNGLPEFYMGLNINNVLVPHKIVPIGNGSSDFFYTLSFLIFHDFNHASFVRINVAQHVADNWDLFKEYAVDPSSQRLYYSAEHYLNEMLKPDTPGRGCELLAAARLFATKFELYIDETLCFHCGMTATNVVRRLKVSPLEGSVHFDAYEPISDEEIKNFGGPQTLNAQNSDGERMRKEFMKSVEKHLLKIIFPDFMIKTAAGDVEHKQVLLTSCTWKDYPDSNRHTCYINRIRAQNKELEKRKNWATGPPSSQSSKKPSEIVTITIEDESESPIHPGQVEESETIPEKDPLECSSSEKRLSKIQQNKEIFRRWKQKEQNEISRRSTGKKQMKNIAERQQMPASERRNELSQDGSQDSELTIQVQSRPNMLGQDILLSENQPSRQKKSSTDRGQSENAIAMTERDASGRFFKKGAVRLSTTDPNSSKKEERRKQYAEKKIMQKATATHIPSAPQSAKSSQGANVQSKSRNCVQKLQKPLGQGSSSSVVISSSTANKEQIEVWKSMPQKKFVILLLSENQNMGKTATIQLPGAGNSSKSSQDGNQHSVPLSSALQLRNILEPNTLSPDQQQRKKVEEKLQSLLRQNGKEFSREWNRLIRERDRTEKKEIAKIEKKFEGEIVQERIRKYEKRKREKAFPLSKSKKRSSLTEKLKRKYENLRKYQTKKKDENEEKLKVTFKIHEDYKQKWVSYRNKKAAEIKAIIDSGSAPPVSETANVVPEIPGPTLELCDINAITDDKPSQVEPLSQDGASEKTSGMTTEPLQQKVTDNLETNFDIINVNIKSELPSPGSPSAEDTEEMEWTADPKVKIEDNSSSGIEASDTTGKCKRKRRARRRHIHDILMQCVSDVQAGKMNLKKAEIFYKISIRTIVCERKRMMKTVFSEKEEKRFISCIMRCCRQGFPVDSFDLRMIAKDYLTSRKITVPCFKNNFPDMEWFTLFFKRHPELSQLFASNIIKCQEIPNEITLRKYVENLEKYVCGVPPENIWNYDEFSLSDGAETATNIIWKKGTKYKSAAKWSVMLTANAAGEMLPPYVVYGSDHLEYNWIHGGPPGTRYNNTSNGWVDNEAFTDWFKNTVLPRMKALNGRKVFIGDYLSSYINLEILELCDAYNISFVCFPPNSDHLTQPLNVAFFKKIEIIWKAIIMEWKNSPMTRSSAILTREFSSLFKKLINMLLPNAKSDIILGFKKCGVTPINVNEVLENLYLNQKTC